MSEYDGWIRRLDEAREARMRVERHVWQPLYEQLLGPRMLGRRDEQWVNAAVQYLDMVEPHLVGGERKVSVRVARVRPGEDAAGKIALAERLGQQATALGRAIGMDVDHLGRAGERRRAIVNSLWSMGVMVLGFHPPAGVVEAQPEQPEAEEAPRRPVDLDFARAGRRELADAGMPYARSVDPRRFLGDATYLDFASGDWFAVECYYSLSEARALYPGRRFSATHRSLPLWSEDAGQQREGGLEGLVRFHEVWQRDPASVLTLPDPRSGVRDIVARTEIDLGLEGLPLRILGGRWIEGQPFPVPALLRGADAGAAESDLVGAIMAAGRKLKTMILVDGTVHEGLAAKLREGDPAGVYEVRAPLGKESIDTREVGAVRQEHLALADRAREIREREAGVSDLALGLREPGDPNVPAVQARAAAMSARMAGLKQPVADWDASVYRALLAVAYAKLDLLSGLQLPLGSGPDAEFAVFDAARPMIGELLDYEFRVYTADALTDADQVNQINNVLQLVPALQAALAQEGTTLRLTPLVEALLRRSHIEDTDAVIQPAAPPGPPPVGEPDREAAGEPGAAPADPAAEMELLGRRLARLPEGSPDEDAILRRMAELQGALAA